MAGGVMAGKDLSADQCNELVALFHSGEHELLERRLRTILAQHPASGFAWMLLGTMLHLQGRDGLSALRRSAKLMPDDPNTQLNLGNVMMDLNRLDDAEACFRHALDLYPQLAHAHFNLGNVQFRKAQRHEAEHSFREALQLDPENADAYNNLGNVLREMDRLDEAEECFRDALRADPSHANAGFNHGNVLRELGRLKEAETSCRRLIHINPDSPDDHGNLANVLKDMGRFDEAVTHYRRAVRLSPGNADLHNNLGTVLNEIGRFGEAEASYRGALQIAPDSADAHGNLGVTLKELGRLTEAEACYRRALQIRPDFVEAFSNLLFAYNYSASHDPSSCLAEARRYGQLVSQRATSRFAEWSCARQPRKLRIGMVSGNFCNHPVGYFLESLLPRIDPSRVELVAYPTHHIVDDLTARIKLHFVDWKPLIGRSDRNAAELIRNDGIHVLLDLAGHTAHNRLPLFAWKPAPVSASWLGYFATTGMTEIDFIIADEVGVPKSQQEFFTEKLCILPGTRLCFSPPLTNLPVTPLPAANSGSITFGCFQRLAKVGDEVLSAWSRILAKLPNARLRWQCRQLGDSAARNELVQRLQQNGIGPDRVKLLGSVTREAYLAAHTDVDLILDTFPFPGGTTTCEALWMGVPTLTLAGNTLLSRQGASLMTAANLPEWVATDEADYIDKAVQFASDIGRLARLRTGLRASLPATPLFDAERFARNFVAAMWEMWESGKQLEPTEIIRTSGRTPD